MGTHNRTVQMFFQPVHKQPVPSIISRPFNINLQVHMPARLMHFQSSKTTRTVLLPTGMCVIQSQADILIIHVHITWRQKRSGADRSHSSELYQAGKQSKPWPQGSIEQGPRVKERPYVSKIDSQNSSLVASFQSTYTLLNEHQFALVTC